MIGRAAPPVALPRPAAALAVVALLAGGCAQARPTVASMAGEAVLSPLPGEVELADVKVSPRRGRIGVPGRDGAVERIVAVDLLPGAAADLVEGRDGSRYGFHRVELGAGTPVTVELRGTAPTGAQVIVTASSGQPVPLYGGPDDVQPVPPELPTSVVITVVSRQ